MNVLENRPFVTIVPLYGISSAWDFEPFDISKLPFEIMPNVQLADVSRWMEALDFSLWQGDFISKKEIDKFKSCKFALKHEYETTYHAKDIPEKESQELLHKIFLGLRIIRPTRASYYYLTGSIKEDNTIDITGFQNPERSVPVPHKEVLNRLRLKDLEMLAAICSELLRVYELKTRNVKWAIRNLEIGYASPHFDVKHLLWVTGLDGLFTSRERKHRGSNVAIARIENFLGSDYSIHEKDNYEYIEEFIDIKLKDVLVDVYELRNYFAHGEYVPDEWLKKDSRKHLTESLTYADVLLESASSALRGALLKILTTNQLDMFTDSISTNKYYSSLGLTFDLLNKQPKKYSSIHTGKYPYQLKP